MPLHVTKRIQGSDNTICIDIQLLEFMLEVRILYNFQTYFLIILYNKTIEFSTNQKFFVNALLIT